MNRKAFYDLLTRYVKGDCTKDEQQLVEQWYQLLHEADRPAPNLHNPDVTRILNAIWLRIRAMLDRKE
jgi:hypothetical protein